MKAKQQGQKVVQKAGKQAGKKGDRPPMGGRGGRVGHSGYISFEQRRKAVKLYLEEGLPSDLVAREIGVGKATVFEWVKRYREVGEEGLRTGYHPDRQRRTNGALTALQMKIVEVKRANPTFGVKRIAQLLKRMFFVPASATTVSRTLHKKQMMPEVRKPKRNPSKPRFFERSTPNQMWQSDIFPFRLTGQFAYLIGFIDDHSRYMTGLGLYRTQTAENVLEVYRRATGAYGVPKEMLTDNGRQYTNWRGKTRFEHELQKDRVHHLRSSPHHPQTLGKIERFWKSIWEEFLSRAQFDTFESARERVAWWVDYYNHQRPHQGVGGLCPADRFFAIQKELGVVMKKGLVGNLQELALRGKSRPPFYMVGRMGDQSVVIREEQGKVRMTVDETEGQAVEYDPEGGKDEHSDGEQDAANTAELQCGGKGIGGPGGLVGAAADSAGVSGTGGELGDPAQLGEAGDLRDAHGAGGSTGRGECGIRGPAAGEAVGIVAGGTGAAFGDGAGGSCAGGGEGVNYPRNVVEASDENGSGTGSGSHGSATVPGGAGGLDGAAFGQAGLRGDGGQRESVPALAGAGDGRVAQGAPAEGGPRGGARAGTEPADEAAAGPQGHGAGREVATVEQAVGELERPDGTGHEFGMKDLCVGEVSHDHGGQGVESGGGAGPAPGGTDHSGAGRTDECGSGGRADGSLPENLLQVGAARPLGDPLLAAGGQAGAAGGTCGQGEGVLDPGGQGAPGTGSGAGANPACESRSAGVVTG